MTNARARAGRPGWLIVLALTALGVYLFWVTWGVYGGFYVGYPPYTPALLNSTRATISRMLKAPRRVRLLISGNVTQGQVVLVLDGKVKSRLTGLVQHEEVIAEGFHVMELQNRDSSGYVNYALQ